MAGFLPDQQQLLGLGKVGHPFVALSVVAKLIAVQKNGSKRIVDITFAFGIANFLTGQFDESERIASTWPEQSHVEMEIATMLFPQTPNKCAVTKLTFSFAA
jgi:hypothetical protein